METVILLEMEFLLILDTYTHAGLPTTGMDTKPIINNKLKRKKHLRRDTLWRGWRAGPGPRPAGTPSLLTATSLRPAACVPCPGPGPQSWSGPTRGPAWPASSVSVDPRLFLTDWIQRNNGSSYLHDVLTGSLCCGVGGLADTGQGLERRHWVAVRQSRYPARNRSLMQYPGHQVEQGG